MKRLLLALCPCVLTGCPLLLIAAIVAVGAGTYLYMDNVLSYEYDVTLAQAWDASRRGMPDLGLKIDSEKKDFQEGILESRMADGRAVRVTCEKIIESKTRVKVRVGDFKGEANRQAAQTLHERIAGRLNVKAPALPPPAEVGSDEMQKMYKAPVSACYAAVERACQKKGYALQTSQRSGEERGTLAAQGSGRQVHVSLYRHQNKTRVVVQVRGAGGTDEYKKRAKELHDEIGEGVREKGED